MKASEVYLKKIANEYIFDLKNTPEAFPNIHKIKRYGEYCNLEGSLEVGLSDVRVACSEMLSKMAKEDSLIINNS